MSLFTRDKKTAHLLGEVGATVSYKFDPTSAFKWKATVKHPSLNGYPVGTRDEMAMTAWGLSLEVRRMARRIRKSQRMNFRADQMTKAAVR